MHGQEEGDGADANEANEKDEDEDDGAKEDNIIWVLRYTDFRPHRKSMKMDVISHLDPMFRLGQASIFQKGQSLAYYALGIAFQLKNA